VNVAGGKLERNVPTRKEARCPKSGVARKRSPKGDVGRRRKKASASAYGREDKKRILIKITGVTET